jgi:predicted permease
LHPASRARLAPGLPRAHSYWGTGVVVIFGKLVPVVERTRDTLWLCALVVSCTPTANNLIVMCDVAGQNKNAMGTAIFTQYIVAPLLLPGMITIFVLIVSSAI